MDDGKRLRWSLRVDGTRYRKTLLRLAEGEYFAKITAKVFEAIGQARGKGRIEGKYKKERYLDSGRLKEDGTARCGGQLSCYAPSMC